MKLMQGSDTYYPHLSATDCNLAQIWKAAAFTKDVQGNKRELRHIC